MASSITTASSSEPARSVFWVKSELCFNYLSNMPLKLCRWTSVGAQGQLQPHVSVEERVVFLKVTVQLLVLVSSQK